MSYVPPPYVPPPPPYVSPTYARGTSHQVPGSAICPGPSKSAPTPQQPANHEYRPGSATDHLRELCVNTLGGDQLCIIFADRDWNIGYVKGLVAPQAGVPQYKQQLVHSGGEIADSERVGDLPGDGLLELTLLRRAPQQMIYPQPEPGLGETGSRTRDPACDQALSMWSDHAWVMQKVHHDGLLLQFASNELKDTRDIVMAAVQNKGCALLHASFRFRADYDVVMTAVKNDGLVLGLPGLGTEYFCDDPSIVLAAARQNGFAAKQACIEKMFCNGQGTYPESDANTATAYAFGHMLLRESLRDP